MPPENSVGRDNRCDFLQHLPSQDLTFDSQPLTLLITEKDTSLSQLLFQNLVSRDQVLDDLLLLTVDPSGRAHKEELPRLQDKTHN